ncbi:fumarylacetoacetate hydrolase family protein [candidate division KSB1 bacterium]|nr:fumarylacetoacetate hydrolase family protein [candidate division KSB1 bacterium]
MKIYKLKTGILLEQDTKQYYLEHENWDSVINDDHLFNSVQRLTSSLTSIENGKRLIETELEPPILSQELWASGVTYYNSKLGRQEESKAAGGGDFYAHVYEAERPELFFKANANRIVGSGGKVRIRQDSSWDVPEPELTLVITSTGKIVGYTIGNDMSSRSIEGENPLYLPQAKTYDGCAALGPCVYVTKEPLPPDTTIYLEIHRDDNSIFTGNVQISQIKRTFDELVTFLYRECTFPFGSLLMTGTGVVPPNTITLKSGDEIHITVQPIGTLINTVE